MNKHLKLFGCGLLLLTAMSNAWAWGRVPQGVPEIDAAAGASAIALLTGAVLLLKERGKSKKGKKDDAE